ncbi:hypothetical protein BC332_28726 [Capsicum chinense]|nr:hypothetical protein BC332_28726 [Capsicum chinense]
MEAPEGLLAKLQMTSSVRDYLSQFEQLANRTSHLNPEMMKHYFIFGLHPNIKSEAEIHRKRELNLCFNCDAKYHKGHRCSSPSQLFLLISEDEPPEESPPPYPSPTPNSDISSSPIEFSLLTISYQASFGGPSTVTSLRFTCQVKGQTTQVLIDDGSTHYFITSRVAKSLKLPIESSVKFSILVVNGHNLPCLGVIHDISITIQGHTFSTNFFFIDLHGSDLVLGLIRLVTLGPIMTDYAQHLFQFDFQGKYVSWSGDPPPTPQQVQPSALRCFNQTNSIFCLLRLELLSSMIVLESDHPPALTHLLDSYLDVFVFPIALPPLHPQDHCILLIPGSTP